VDNAGMTEAETGRWTRPRAVARIAVQLAVIALAVHLVLPQLAGLQATGRALARATWWVPLLVLVLEAASLLAYAELLKVVLASMGQPAPRGLLQRATVAGLSLGRTLPGGNATALAMTVSSLRAAGLDGTRVTAGLAVGGALSSVVLAVLLPAAALLSLTGGHGGGIAFGAAGMAAVVVAAAALARPAVRRADAAGRLAARVARVVLRGPLRARVDPEAVGARVRRALEGVDRLARDRRALALAGGWAAANWLLDIAALTVVALTVGRGVPLVTLPLAYILAQWVAAIPLTPGGVGVVEAAMTATLVASGAPGGAATATVLGWRLVSHWLPILIGLALLPTLRHTRARS
jgi:uncharacterized protein (TIRG00374 family)